MDKGMVITGASSGIGQTLYGHYGSAHNIFSKPRVIGMSRRGPDVHVDLSGGHDREQWRDAIRSAGHDDVVVILNAGIMSVPERWEALDDMWSINLRHPMRFLSDLDHEEYSGVSSVILISSVAGVQGSEDVPLYSALKAGVINLTRSYAKKLAERGIRVNCISPGFVKTNLVPGNLPKELLEKVPMRREAEPEELIPIVDALIHCKYITGQNIVVDGGKSL